MSPPMPAGPTRALLLDLDGTLLDTCPLLFAAFRHTVAAHLGRDAAYAEWFAGFGLPIHAHMRELCSTDGGAGAMVATYRAFVHAQHDAYVRCFDGVGEALRTI